MSKIIKGNFPYSHFFKMIGGKWKPYILITIENNGSARFNSFLRGCEEMSSRMLSAHLKELISDGLIDRHEIPDSLQHVEYTLTEKGKLLIPILKAIYKFSMDDMIDKDIQIDSRAFDFFDLSEI